MNRFDHQWQKLTALARSAPADRDAGVPYGFATRVTTQAAALPSAGLTTVFERFALRGLLVAAACGVAAIAFNFYGVRSDPSASDAATSDTVGDLLDLS